jgi:hypothetical protein
MKVLARSTATMLAAAALYAAPAMAMTQPPSEPGTSTSSGGATAVPEPGVIGLFGIAALAIGMRSRRRKTR